MADLAAWKQAAEAPRGTGEVVSHSYGDGYLPGDPKWRFEQLLAAMLGAGALRNVSASGARSYSPVNGYGNATEDLVRPGHLAGDGYLAAADFGVILLGTNEAAGTTAASQNAMRVILAKLRAAKIFEDSHGSWAFSQGASAATTPDSGMSGATRWAITANGATATITVPADVHAGATISIFIGAITPTDAFTITWTLNGQPAGVDAVAAGVLNGQALNAQLVRRIAGANPGDTIVGTVTGITGSARFDCYGVEAEIPQPVAVCSVPRLPNAYSGLPALNQAKVDSLNAAWQAVCGEFGDQAPYVDLDPALNFGDTRFFYSDLIHPNARGHWAIADTIATALRKRRRPAAGGSAGGMLGLSSALTLYNGWTSVPAARPASFRRTPANVVMLQGRLEHLTTAPVLGQTVAILPAEYRPAAQLTLLAAGEGATPCVWTVSLDGTVAYTQGSVAIAAKASLDGIQFTAER